MASSVASKVIFCFASIFITPRSCRLTICAMSCSLKGVNRMMSSIRFKNSGRTVCLSNPRTSTLAASRALSRSLIASKRSWITLLPILEVMIIMVFLKSATRPLLSVRRPSSRTCNKILKVSGCAFSISSNKTTEYGLRLTASVSCPPSS